MPESSGKPGGNPKITRVSLRDVARTAGVSHATVSMSLRGNPSIPESTRGRIRAIADKMGYRPDPMLSALAAYRVAKARPSFHGVIAWLNNYPRREMLREVGLFHDYFLGASERAAELGYDLQEHWLGEPGMTSSRFSRVLRNRGIQAILVAPQPHSQTKILLDWELFTSVSFGFSLDYPKLHMVCPAQYRAGLLATRTLREKGYRRVLFVSGMDFQIRTDWNFLAAFQIEQRNFPTRDRLPPLLFDEPTTWPDNNRIEAITADRVRKTKPDVVLASSHFAKQWLETNGVAVPQNVALATLDYHDVQPEVSGVDQHGLQTGRAAVDLLDGMLKRGEKGQPPNPYRLLVEPEWREGTTTPSPARQPLNSQKFLKERSRQHRQ